MLIELIEIFQRGFDRVGLLHAAGYRLKTFVTLVMLITIDSSRGIRPFG
jgi:hypothetical protein